MVFLSAVVDCMQKVDSVHQYSGLMRLTNVKYVLLIVSMAACAWAQAQSGEPKREPSPGKQIGSGAGNIGIGAAKGAGNLAKGAGKGAVDLVTLHPINAASSVGKGAVVGGKDVAVGTAKGTGKIGKGIGRAVKKLF
jgi:hypothetical protein